MEVQLWFYKQSADRLRLKNIIKYSILNLLYRNFHFIHAAHMAYAMHKSPLEKGAKGVVNLSSWNLSS